MYRLSNRAYSYPVAPESFAEISREPPRRTLDWDAQFPWLDKAQDLEPRCHWGQRKLFFSELEFLTHLAERVGIREGTVVVYAGAAAGHHIPILCRLFPQVEWHLYDPAPFHEGLRNEPQVRTYRQFFLDETARDLAAKFAQRPLRIFISDIRLEPTDANVVEDLRNQMRWGVTLGAHMMLKFRLPFADGAFVPRTAADLFQPGSLPGVSTDAAQRVGVGEMLYLDGEVRTQLNGPYGSAETRLWVGGPTPPATVRKISSSKASGKHSSSKKKARASPKTSKTSKTSKTAASSASSSKKARAFPKTSTKHTADSAETPQSGGYEGPHHHHQYALRAYSLPKYERALQAFNFEQRALRFHESALPPQVMRSVLSFCPGYDNGYESVSEIAMAVRYISLTLKKETLRKERSPASPWTVVSLMQAIDRSLQASTGRSLVSCARHTYDAMKVRGHGPERALKRLWQDNVAARVAHSSELQARLMDVARESAPREIFEAAEASAGGHRGGGGWRTPARPGGASTGVYSRATGANDLRDGPLAYVHATRHGPSIRSHFDALTEGGMGALLPRFHADGNSRVTDVDKRNIEDLVQIHYSDLFKECGDKSNNGKLRLSCLCDSRHQKHRALTLRQSVDLLKEWQKNMLHAGGRRAEECKAEGECDRMQTYVKVVGSWTFNQDRPRSSDMPGITTLAQQSRLAKRPPNFKLEAEAAAARPQFLLGLKDEYAETLGQSGNYVRNPFPSFPKQHIDAMTWSPLLNKALIQYVSHWNDVVFPIRLLYPVDKARLRRVVHSHERQEHDMEYAGLLPMPFSVEQGDRLRSRCIPKEFASSSSSASSFSTYRHSSSSSSSSSTNRPSSSSSTYRPSSSTTSLSSTHVRTTSSLLPGGQGARRAPRDDAAFPIYVFVDETEPEPAAYGRYKLLSFRGREIDWGDYLERRTVTYYEIQQLMFGQSEPEPESGGGGGGFLRAFLVVPTSVSFGEASTAHAHVLFTRQDLFTNSGGFFIAAAPHSDITLGFLERLVSSECLSIADGALSGTTLYAYGDGDGDGDGSLLLLPVEFVWGDECGFKRESDIMVMRAVAGQHAPRPEHSGLAIDPAHYDRDLASITRHTPSTYSSTSTSSGGGEKKKKKLKNNNNKRKKKADEEEEEPLWPESYESVVADIRALWARQTSSPETYERYREIVRRVYQTDLRSRTRLNGVHVVDGHKLVRGKELPASYDGKLRTAKAFSVLRWLRWTRSPPSFGSSCLVIAADFNMTEAVLQFSPETKVLQALTTAVTMTPFVKLCDDHRDRLDARLLNIGSALDAISARRLAGALELQFDSLVVDLKSPGHDGMCAAVSALLWLLLLRRRASRSLLRAGGTCYIVGSLPESLREDEAGLLSELFRCFGRLDVLECTVSITTWARDPLMGNLVLSDFDPAKALRPAEEYERLADIAAVDGRAQGLPVDPRSAAYLAAVVRNMLSNSEDMLQHTDEFQARMTQ